MRLPRVISAIVPPPRRPVTWRRSLPLILFLVVYAATCLILDRTGRLLFTRPERFALMAAAPWVWWMHMAGAAGLSPLRGLAALVTRLLLIGLFVMLLAEPRAVRTRDVLSVVYAVDISDSIGDDTTDEALQFVAKTAVGKPKTDEIGLVVFGRNSAVEMPPRTSYPFEAINSRIDRDATDLEKALALSAAMLPERNAGRIVLISDGTQTQGSLSRILGQLKSRDIAVDVLPIQYQYDREVWLERLDLPRQVKLGEPYQAEIVLSSLTAGQGRLVLRENNHPIFDETVHFKAGKNRYSLPIRLRAPGYYEYAATIEVPRTADHLRRNNTVLNYIYVAGEGKVLIVTDPQGDERDWAALVKAVRQGNRVVETKTAFEFPRDALSLMPYDAVVFVNVAADAFDAVQLQALQTGVKEMGVGFLMVGGPNSFGPGGYHRTAIEEVLPVSMDVTKKKILPKGALVIILHTCEFPQGNTWAKRITKQAIKVLGARDEVGAIAYGYNGGGGGSWIFKLTPAGQYAQLVPKINAASIGDMPSFGPTMQMGLTALKANDAATKHMIIISDGDASAPTPQLLQSFRTNHISISTVTIFPHSRGANSPELRLMGAIAAFTGGRHYFVNRNPNQLPSIFIKEAKTLKRSMIQEKTVTPELGFPSPVLKGIETIPPIHGYVLTTPKNRAEVLLKVPMKEKDDDQIDPVLAVWRHGLGTTAAFTSDLSPKWGADWIRWNKQTALVRQLMTRISRVRKKGNLRLWSYANGNRGMVMVEDFAPEETFLEVQARVTGPGGQSQTLPLKQVGPRRYQAEIPLWGKGRYQVMAVGVAGERTDRAQGGFIVPYSPEYLRFRSNPIVLKQIAKQTGGVVLSKEAAADDIYLQRRIPRRSSWPVFDWFLIALACLVPLDVAIRRIQIDPYAIWNWLRPGHRTGPSTETMSTLLERKKTVATTLDARREERPLESQQTVRPVTSRPKSTDTSGQKPPQSAANTQPAESSDEEQSTMSRLLEMKRRRKQEENES